MDFDNIIVPLGIFYMIYCSIKVLSNHFIKRMLIKNNMISQSERLIIPEKESEESTSAPSLKWGIVTLFAGIGILVGTSLYPLLNSYGKDSNYLVSGIIPAIIIIFISVGFLTYFFISHRIKK